LMISSTSKRLWW